MQHCPRCASERVHLSRTRSKWEEWREAITGKRPYRCSACRWRWWARDVGPQFSSAEIESAFRALDPDPPNLKETVLARAEHGPQEVESGKLDGATPERPDITPQGGSPKRRAGSA